MSDNVGLTTPRGSGTSGYVQRNTAHLKPRDFHKPYPGGPNRTNDKEQPKKYIQRKPDAAILEHNRLRAIESKVFALRDELEEEGKLGEEEIEERCEGLRKELSAKGVESVDGSAGGKGRKEDAHELARRKIEESERFRKALGVREDYEEGGYWKRKEEVQEERRRRDEEGERKGEERGGGGWEEKVRQREKDRQGARGYDFD
ncbi:hypothetical protein MBLNU230_g6493t1 [Neophaeotheca triangularis]